MADTISRRFDAVKASRDPSMFSACKAIFLVLRLMRSHAEALRLVFERYRSTLRTIRAPIMLMYGKEASNRKQEIDRQHYTIPNQRPKDKHCGKI